VGFVRGPAVCGKFSDVSPGSIMTSSFIVIRSGDRSGPGTLLLVLLSWLLRRAHPYAWTAFIPQSSSWPPPPPTVSDTAPRSHRDPWGSLQPSSTPDLEEPSRRRSRPGRRVPLGRARLSTCHRPRDDVRGWRIVKTMGQCGLPSWSMTVLCGDRRRAFSSSSQRGSASR